MEISLFDIAVAVTLIVLLLIGLLRGFHKLFFGLVASLIAIVLAVTLTGPISNTIIENTQLDDQLVTTLAQPISAKMPYGTYTLVYADTDADPQTPDVLGFYEGAEWHEFKDLFTSSSVQKMSPVLEKMIIKQYPDDASQLSFVLIFSKLLSALIVSIVVFIVLWLVLGLIFTILKRLLKKAVGGTYIGHFLDRVLGAVFGVIIGWVCIMVVLCVIQILSPMPFMQPVTDYINASISGPILIKYNFLFQLVGASINVGALAGKVGLAVGA